MKAGAGEEFFCAVKEEKKINLRFGKKKTRIFKI